MVLKIQKINKDIVFVLKISWMDILVVLFRIDWLSSSVLLNFGLNFFRSTKLKIHQLIIYEIQLFYVVELLRKS